MDLCSLTALYWEGVSYVVSILSPSYSQCRVDDDDDGDDDIDGDGAEMQKAASMASALVLILPPAVLILGIQHRLLSISTAVLIFGLWTALLK